MPARLDLVGRSSVAAGDDAVVAIQAPVVDRPGAAAAADQIIRGGLTKT
jgi:hypothetical protein